MSRKKKKELAFMVLAAISMPAAGDWHGFHGLEKEGKCDAVDSPLIWSSNQNVAWKTPIPGRGHSSPIVSENAVYLTSTYESQQLGGLHSAWNYAILVLVLLFTLVAVHSTIQRLEGKPTGVGGLWQHVRIFLFGFFLGCVIVISVFGRHLLVLDDSAYRPLLASVVLVLSCLICCSLFAPVKSPQHLLVGLLSFVLTFAAFVMIQDKGVALAHDSLKGLIGTGIFLSPLVLGCILLTVYLLSHKRHWGRSPNVVVCKLGRPVLWRYTATGSLGFVFSGVPFFLLLYRAANYQMPDSYIWHDRINPDVSWWSIGLFFILVAVKLASCISRAVRGSAVVRPPLQLLYLVFAVALGALFFVRVNLVEESHVFARAVICLDRDSGTVLWTCEGLVGDTRGRSRTVTHASATPVTDGRRIYGYFGADGLMCVSLKGKLLWKKQGPLFYSKFAVGTSPVVKDDILIVVSDVQGTKELLSSITAFDCATGKVLWKKGRESHRRYAAYGTPLIISLDGEQVVIVHGWHGLKGYHLKTGQELWSYPLAHEGKHLVASLVSDDRRLYVIGTKQVRALDLSRLGTDHDPVVWSEPIAGEKSSTPVVVDGLLYLITETGKAHCLDARTGDIMWEARLKGRYYSSVVATGKRVLFTSESGITTIVANDREFRKLSENHLGGSVYASIAPAGRQLFVRTHRHLYCIQEDREG